MTALQRPEDETLELFTFSVATHKYAVDLARVEEVLPPTEVSPASGGQPPVVGELLLRGERVPVVELRRCLPDGPLPEGARPGLLVCWLGRRKVAFRIDAVGTVARVAVGSLGAPPTGEGVSVAVAAVWAQPPDVHFLLDLKELLRGQSPSPSPAG
jgi:purine-binding chemotaxis protein CheW